MKQITSNYPWVFWFNIRFRKWFTWYHRNRGANFLEIQIFFFAISIGRPWMQSYIDSSVRDYGSAKHIHRSNKENLKSWFSFLIKPKMAPVNITE